jgi:hypothetical protein
MTQIGLPNLGAKVIPYRSPFQGSDRENPFDAPCNRAMAGNRARVARVAQRGGSDIDPVDKRVNRFSSTRSANVSFSRPFAGSEART